MMTEHTPEERNWAIAAHLSALVAVVGVPFGHVIGPLVVYLIQRDKSSFAASHARASLNFQITLSIAALLFFVLAFAGWAVFIVSISSRDATLPLWAVGAWFTFLCGVLLAVGLAIALVVAGAVAASNDRPYRYPFTFTFVR
jgi:uncharacterized Tic20 family protein